jgi:hypothetical protein
MAYTVENFPTKKAFKEAVKAYLADFIHAKEAGASMVLMKPVRCYNPGLGPDLSNYTGKIAVEGPHAPQPHRWYAEVELVNGVVVSVK